MPVSEKKLRSNPAWIKRHLTDPFVKKSVQEGFRARSVYKLMEIDDKDKIIKARHECCLIRRCARVLDPNC